MMPCIIKRLTSSPNLAMAEQSDGGDKVLASVENRAVKRHPSPDLISKEPQTKKRRLESDVEEESKPNQQHTPSTTTVIRSPMSTTRTGAGVMQTPTSRRSHKANDEEEGRFDFISEDKIRDAKGRRPDHPEYDRYVGSSLSPSDFVTYCSLVLLYLFHRILCGSSRLDIGNGGRSRLTTTMQFSCSKSENSTNSIISMQRCVTSLRLCAFLSA